MKLQYRNKDGKKYGYICMTCGKTVSYGTNKDGECKSCHLGRRPRLFYIR